MKMRNSELRERVMSRKAGEGRPRRSISSAKLSRRQKVCSIIQGDVLGSFVDKDMHCECKGQMGS